MLKKQTKKNKKVDIGFELNRLKFLVKKNLEKSSNVLKLMGVVDPPLERRVLLLEKKAK